MKTLFWQISLLGIFLFSVISSAKVQQFFFSKSLSLHKNNIELANVAPICLARSDIPDEELHWLYMPNTAGELATSEYYGYLSGQLIISGAVDAADCPLKGLWPNGYANSCGLEKTREASLYLQNVYDDEILAAGREIGVPPVMIKQLIRYESQFWPLRMGPYHFGLGHITSAGASNALVWNRALFETTNGKADQLLILMDASCPSCPLKIDIPKAEQSIMYLAGTLQGYCKQTSQVVYNATKKNAGDVVDYATIWKLTLLNYNAGPSCVYSAVHAGFRADGSKLDDILSWDEIVSNSDSKSCDRGISYVENITREYYDFVVED